MRYTVVSNSQLFYFTIIIDSNFIYYLSILDLPGTSETYLDVPVAQNITGVTGVFEKNIRKKPVNKSLHTPDFKWKSTGKFSPKTNSFNSSKVIHFIYYK